MKLELYYYDECGFCQMVLHTINNLGIQDKVAFKNKLQNQEYAQELIQLTGRTQVPCLVIDGKPMFESTDISNYLESNFS